MNHDDECIQRITDRTGTGAIPYPYLSYVTAMYVPASPIPNTYQTHAAFAQVQMHDVVHSEAYARCSPDRPQSARACATPGSRDAVRELE